MPSTHTAHWCTQALRCSQLAWHSVLHKFCDARYRYSIWFSTVYAICVSDMAIGSARSKRRTVLTLRMVVGGQRVASREKHVQRPRDAAAGACLAQASRFEGRL
eukprot:2723316-Rhodomonas_salina.1